MVDMGTVEDGDAQMSERKQQNQQIAQPAKESIAVAAIGITRGKSAEAEVALSLWATRHTRHSYTSLGRLSSAKTRCATMLPHRHKKLFPSLRLPSSALQGQAPALPDAAGLFRRFR